MFSYMGAAVSAVVAATPEQIWPIVSDVTRHPQLAGSGEVRAVQLVDATAPAAGVVFTSQQVMRGLAYTTANRIVVWQPPYRLVWRVGVPLAPGFGQAWHFQLTPFAGGTRVENAVALMYALPEVGPLRRLHDAMGSGYADSVVPTLERLSELVGAPPPLDRQIHLRPPTSLTDLLPPAAVSGSLLLAAAIGGLALGSALLRRIAG